MMHLSSRKNTESQASNPMVYLSSKKKHLEIRASSLIMPFLIEKTSERSELAA